MRTEKELKELAVTSAIGLYATTMAGASEGCDYETVKALAKETLANITSDMSHEELKIFEIHFKDTANKISIKRKQEEYTRSIEREKIMANAMTACCNIALLYIINIVVIQVCIDKMYQYWNDTKIEGKDGKQVYDAMQMIDKKLKNNDDVSCLMTKRCIMPIVWQKMNAFKNEYEGYSNIVDDIQFGIKGRVNTIFCELYGVCDGVEGKKENETPMAKYAIIVYAISSQVIEEISKRYENSGLSAEDCFKIMRAPKPDLSLLKQVADKCKLIANTVTGYSLGKDKWLSLGKAITDKMTEIYKGFGSIVIDAIEAGARSYYGYYFGMMALAKRYKIPISERVKNDCIRAYGSKGGYAQVMKDVKKLNEFAWELGDAYQIGSMLMELMKGGEKFPAINKILSNKITENKDGNIRK